MLKKFALKSVLGSLIVAAFAFVTFDEASASTLSNAQKEELYNQYQTVIEEVRGDYNLSPDELSLSPISEFTDEAWVDAETFKERAIHLSQLEATSVVEVPSLSLDSEIQPFNTLSNSVTQKKSFTYGSDIDFDVTFTANFYTVYNTTQGRMVFSNLANFSSSSNKGKWSVIATKPLITEGGRSLKIEGTGKLVYLGAEAVKTYTLLYTCSSSGTVSVGF